MVHLEEEADKVAEAVQKGMYVCMHACMDCDCDCCVDIALSQALLLHRVLAACATTLTLQKALDSILKSLILFPLVYVWLAYQHPTPSYEPPSKRKRVQYV